MKDKMSEGKLGRSAICFSDPDVFASEMIKMINEKDFRYSTNIAVFPLLVVLIVM